VYSAVLACVSCNCLCVGVAGGPRRAKHVGVNSCFTAALCSQPAAVSLMIKGAAIAGVPGLTCTLQGNSLVLRVPSSLVIAQVIYQLLHCHVTGQVRNIICLDNMLHRSTSFNDVPHTWHVWHTSTWGLSYPCTVTAQCSESMLSLHSNQQNGGRTACCVLLHQHLPSSSL
jgi:hypothetical protein